jgi:hypothetical protein
MTERRVGEEIVYTDWEVSSQNANLPEIRNENNDS